MSGNLCEQCVGACCRYIALPIEEPTTASEFNDIRWYLIHENVSVFVEDGDWYISFHTTCRHLLADHRCGIYETRPKICRKYTTDNCDYHSGDYGWEEHFTTPEHLEEYLQRNKAKARTKRTSSKNGGRVIGTRTRIKSRGVGQVQLDKYGHELPALPVD